MTESILYIATIAAVVLSLFAQIYVSSTFKRFSRKATLRGESAESVARYVLDEAGCYDVCIERVGGSLTDHYDPRTKTLRLSDSVYGNASAAAIGVACHEAGHAIQHRANYFPVKVRSALVPVTTFASRTWTWVLIAGVALMYLLPMGGTVGYLLMFVGLGALAVSTAFQLVTLPCELDASKRALRAMRKTGYFASRELGSAKKVLTAAALTYIAAALVSVLQLLRLISILGRRR